MSEPLLQAQDLYKSYGRRKVLRGVNFSVQPGTLIGIVGENGAGKSTQNPLGNPVANQGFLRWFPSFAPMQISFAGAFAQNIPWLYMLYSLAWPAGFALLGLGIFWWKTHARSVHTMSSSKVVLNKGQ